MTEKKKTDLFHRGEGSDAYGEGRKDYRIKELGRLIPRVCSIFPMGKEDGELLGRKKEAG